MFNKSVLWDLSYGVYVVSSFDNKRATGCIANCAVQLTENLIGVSINRNNYTNCVIKENGSFALSILSENTNPDIISVFGFSTGKDSDKFEKIAYETIGGMPVVKDSVGYLILKVTNEVELDTHTFFIGEITGGDVFSDKIPMTYKFYHDVIKGRAPKNAPTYIDPDELPAKTEGAESPKRFRCKICGYIYEGDISKEPPNYVCPVCKQPKSVFEPIAYA